MGDIEKYVKYRVRDFMEKIDVKRFDSIDPEVSSVSIGFYVSRSGV